MSVRWTILLLTTIGAVSGCVTPTQQLQQQRQAARDRAETERVMVAVQTLDQKVLGLAASQEQLARQIDQIRESSHKDDAPVKQRLSDLEAHLRSQEVALRQLRSQIVDELTKRVTEGMKLQAQNVSQPPVQSGREHTVRAGESLSKIAAAYKVSVAAIAKANNLKNSSPVRTGQKLFIPEAAP